jgi:hypothetical protein
MISVVRGTRSISTCLMNNKTSLGLLQPLSVDIHIVLTFSSFDNKWERISTIC